MRWLAVVSLVVLVGCGDQIQRDELPPPGLKDPDGALLEPDAGFVSNTAECLVAVQINTCCPAPRPASRKEVLADACLVPWPVEVIHKGCEPNACPSQCPPLEPVSRLARPSDDGPGCQWAHECERDADCTAGFDRRRCCSCVTALPRALVSVDPCVVVADDLMRTPDVCQVQCLTDCKPCPPFWSAPRCLTAKGALQRNRCVD